MKKYFITSLTIILIFATTKCPRQKVGAISVFEKPTLQDLFDAIEMDQPNLVRAILLDGVNPNVLNAQGLAPLHVAAMENKPLVAQALLQNGALPNITNMRGETPLHLATWDDNCDIATVLIADPRTNVRQVDNFGHTPLYYTNNFYLQELIQQRLEQDIEALGRDIADDLLFGND